MPLLGLRALVNCFKPPAVAEVPAAADSGRLVPSAAAAHGTPVVPPAAHRRSSSERNLRACAIFDRSLQTGNSGLHMLGALNEDALQRVIRQLDKPSLLALSSTGRSLRNAVARGTLSVILKDPKDLVPALARYGANGLNKITLEGREFTHEHIAHLAQKCPGLPHLSLSECDVTEEMLSELSRFQQLAHLDFDGRLPNTADLGFSRIAALPHLRHLGVRYLELKTGEGGAVYTGAQLEQAMQQISTLSLTHLDFDCRRFGNGFTAWHISSIREIRSLQNLDLHLTDDMDDAAIQDIEDMQGLRSLALHGGHITTLRGIEKLTELEHLDVSSLQHMANEGLEAIGSLPKLAHLSMRQTSTLPGPQFIASLASLVSLNFNLDGVFSDSPILGIPVLPHLQYLTIKNNTSGSVFISVSTYKYDLADFFHLAKFTGLKTVDLGSLIARKSNISQNSNCRAAGVHLDDAIRTTRIGVNKLKDQGVEVKANWKSQVF
jgi:hypothetical protein